MMTLLDRFLMYLAKKRGLISAPEAVVSGHVWARIDAGPELYLGANTLTEEYSVEIACLLARNAASYLAVDGVTVTYDVDEGFTDADSVFPTQLAIGTGTSAATRADKTLESPLLKSGSTAYYTLQRIDVRRTPAQYTPPDFPIGVNFYFTIPAGETWDDGSGGFVSDVTIREFALFGPAAPAILPAYPAAVDSDMKTRRVQSIQKEADANLFIRYELRT